MGEKDEEHPAKGRKVGKVSLGRAGESARDRARSRSREQERKSVPEVHYLHPHS